MNDRQSAKAAARESAKTAPKADPEIAKRALEDAKHASRKGESTAQPVYKTQEDIAGDNIHRDKKAIISEFDSPAENTVKDN